MKGYIGTKVYTEQQGKQEAMAYCSKEERTQKDVFEKLTKLGLNSQEADNVIAYLISEGFINETRYANLYCISKFHQNKWGKTKIKFSLKQKGLSNKCIEDALDTIDNQEYCNVCLVAAKKKFESLKGNGDQMSIKRQKTAAFLATRGFEFDLINKILDSVCAK